jgi:acetyltransferase-like isoleucine patch superfamily enzyme
MNPLNVPCPPDPHSALRFSAVSADRSRSPLRKYQELVIGDRRLAPLLRFELSMLLAQGLPGALGLLLRHWLFPPLFGRAGRGTVFGRHLTLRSPRRIHLGARVALDDYVMLSVRGGQGVGIEIDDDVLVGRGAVLKTRAGSIRIGSGTSVGFACRIGATSPVIVGRHCLLGARCYIGGADHGHAELDVPVLEQPLATRGGVVIEDNVWLGAHVVVLDGVTICQGAIVGAGAVVTGPIPAYAKAAGVPARIIGHRRDSA